MSDAADLERRLSTLQPQLDFVRGQVWPRWRRLLFAWRNAVVMAAALLAAITADRLPLRDVRVSEAALAGLAFASLSFGACVTGAVLAIGLPPRERVRSWSTDFAPGSRFSAYSELLFTFTWSAYAQLIAVLALAAAYVAGGDVRVVVDNMYVTHRLGIGLLVLFLAYGVVQLFTVVSTISMLGTVISYEETKAELQERRSASIPTEPPGDGIFR